MTQGALAERAGLTQSYLSKLERLPQNVGLDTLLRLQQALELASLEDLFGSSPPAPTAQILAELLE